jgi:hypothetical protein
MDSDLPNDISFLIENENYVIQGVNYNLSKKIPLSVKAATNTTFKFYVSEIVDFDDSQPIYIYDSIDMSYHDIKSGPYEVTVDPGTNKDRFKISFTNKTLGVNDNIKTDFIITQNNSKQLLNAMNISNETIKSFVLYDTQGRIILSKNNLGTEQHLQFSTSGLSSGIYIATFLTDDNSKITQKVIISNAGR